MAGKWAVGDKCLAPFSGDGTLYRAVIQKLETDGDGCKRAEVWYKGYSSEENELVNLDKLQDIARSKKSCEKRSSQHAGFESPLLHYMSEEDRIRAQYADIYDDLRPGPACTSALNKSSTPKGSNVATGSKKRKGTVAFGGGVKVSPKTATIGQPKKISQPVATTSPKTCEVNWNLADLEEGFSAKDVEKPLFPGKSDIGDKEPLILSSPNRKPVIQVPGTINRYLREYQREGVRFLYSHYKNDGGAILGDDMGLGKTVQVIAFIAAVLGKTGGKEDLERRLPDFLQKESPQKSSTKPKTFLIICPNSVLYNWLDEFETWTHCIVARYHGKERDDTLRKARRGRLDAVLTTYETYRLYLDDLLTVSWDAVFVDEVHKIKEPSALITQALKDINTNRRFGLTGTALQNKIMELWCVLDWANPGCLGYWTEFKQEYEKVITTGQKYNASKRELADARQVAKKFSMLRSKWMIRRTKAIIAHQLPSKDENVVFCNLTSFQLDVYRALLDSQDMKLVLEQKNPCDCGRGLKRGRCCYKRNDRGEGIKSLTFGLMSLLIKVSNHIALLMPDVSKSKKQREKALRYCEIAFAKQPQFVELSRAARFATLSDPTYCGKMQVLERLLRVFKRENSKVLLFSCYTQLLDILEMFMKTTSYTYRRLDGKTPAQDRQKYVHEFNKDPDIFLFLISTKAGGIGLNLTGANVVIIFDPNWNPTYDLQAQDRAYRIGQHRDVRVYRLISRGSIEENMYLRQVYKQQLASVAVTTENAKRYFTAVAGDKEQQGEIFGLQNLFALRVDGSCLTKDVIQREEKTELGISVTKYQPQTSVEDEPEDPLDELLQEKNDGDEETPKDREVEDDDDDDIHGMASQLLDIEDNEEDEDDDDGCSHSNDSEVEEAESRRRGKKLSVKETRMRTSLKRPCRDSIASSDLDESKEEDEEGWRGQLRKLTRGKAIIGKHGQPIQKVKGQMRGDHQSFKERNNQRRSRPSVGDDDDDEDREEKREEIETEQKIQRMDSGNIRTAEDVFKKCGVEYVHSNQKVVGASRIEDHVSNVAQRDVFEIGQFSQEPAYCQVPTLDMDTVKSQCKPKSAPRKIPSLSRFQSQAVSHRLGDTTLLVGQTPISVKKAQFTDMASVLDFRNPSALACHIQGLSDEACLKVLLAYHKSKHNVDLDEFIKLPAKPNEDSKSVCKTGAGRRSAEKQEPPLDQQRTKGRRGHGRRDSRVQRREAAPVPRYRQAPVGLTFESSSSNDGNLNFDSDDMGGEPSPVKRSNSRTRSRQVEGEGNGRAKRRGKGRVVCGRRGMMSHEVYQELFDDDDEISDDFFGALQEDVRPKMSRDSAGKHCNRSTTAEHASISSKSSINEQEHEMNNPKQDPCHVNEKVIRDETHEKMPVACPKREESMSFLDDIFLSDARASRRRPPPKKQVARRDKYIAATSESDNIFSAESITTADNSDFASKVMPEKNKNLEDSSTPGSSIFTQFSVRCDTDIVMETIDSEDRDLWKRNETFLPRPTCFDESEASDDSESLFVANPKFISGSGAIT